VYDVPAGRYELRVASDASVTVETEFWR